jgi:hypothetical protein
MATGIERDPYNSVQQNQTVSSHEKDNVSSIIKTASKNTGVSFHYLMAQANKESSFQSSAHAKHSSASGLFQFTQNTWLELIKKHGNKYGLDDFSSQIEINSKGIPVVSSLELKDKILELRTNPEISSMMAGEYAKENTISLEKKLGRKITSTELYLAHFLGPRGATLLLKSQEINPNQPAASLLPKAASKNRSLFYDRNQQPLSVLTLYDNIHHMIEGNKKALPILQTIKNDGVASQHNNMAPLISEQNDHHEWTILSSTSGNNDEKYIKLAQEEMKSAVQVSCAISPAQGHPGSYDKNSQKISNKIYDLLG